MSRKKIAAGNWKMHLTPTEASSLTSEVINIVRDEYNGKAEVILGVPFPYLGLVNHQIKDVARFSVSAQNCHQEKQGAYTGETSAPMIAAMGASYVILGHSERRAYFAEGNALLASKIDAALAAGLLPIYCVGETLEEREADKTFDVIRAQMEEGSFHLAAENFAKVVVAYEPVWAIGTGKTASPAQAQEVHAFIRSLIAAKYSAELANGISILYGGSVKPGNARELFGQADIDGGLVGGASLVSRDFAEIIKAL